MFDFLETPCKETGLGVTINFIEIRGGKTITYDSVVGSSILFSREFIDFHTEKLNTSNPKKYHNIVRFPVKFVKYFDCQEIFLDRRSSEPPFYTLNFHIILDEVSEFKLP